MLNEPAYGFCQINSHSNEELAQALELVRRQICAYGGGNRGSGSCDCKYGASIDTATARRLEYYGGEQTGCPELREVIQRLLHRPESFVGVSDE
jgi:hypothetical protein